MVDFVTLIVQSYFDTLLRYVLSVTFCGAFVMKVMDQTQAAQTHYMNADVTLACEQCCVTNG